MLAVNALDTFNFCSTDVSAYKLFLSFAFINALKYNVHLCFEGKVIL